MAGKPDLSATAGVQNVVVYVSNENFGHAYAVTSQQQQNVSANAGPTDFVGQQPVPPPPPPPLPPPQTMAAAKYSVDKNALVKSADYHHAPTNGQLIHPSNGGGGGGGYFISQNGFAQPLVNNFHPNGVAVSGATATATAAAILKSYGGVNGDVLAGERQAGPGRPDLNGIVNKMRDDCAGADHLVDYVTVMGPTDLGTTQSVRCDSVRSETAESSCSSLSSADEGIVQIIQNQTQDMVVYDSSVSVRPGGVVLTVGQSGINQQPNVVGGNQQAPQPPSISVPYGWKRILNNGSIIYISPSNTALSAPEQVKEYLLSTGTCKCGLECHFKYDNIFNFDPKVANKPWILSPDTNTGDLTKLCNHKRKILEMASLECKSDPNMKLRKDYNTKRSKRKNLMSYTGPMPVSHVLAQRDKIATAAVAANQQFTKEVINNQSQVWQYSQIPNQQMTNRLQVYSENQQHHHHHLQQQQQQRHPEIQNRLQPQFYNNGPQNQYSQIQYDAAAKHMRMPFMNNHLMNGYRLQGVVQNPNNQIVQTPFMINSQQQQPQQRLPWPPNRVHPNPQLQNAPPQQTPNIYERVPPLHQHHTGSPTPWQEEVKRKKVKLGKVVKNSRASYNHMMDCQTAHSAPCPNIDIRQIQTENGRNNAVIINQLSQTNQNAPSPSFMEDPSGYLAQQTALLNHTINRQTGGNACTSGMICNSPSTSMNNHGQMDNVMNVSQNNEVPLPSNVMMSHNNAKTTCNNRTNPNMNIVKNQIVPQPNIIMPQQQYNQIITQGIADSSATNESNPQSQHNMTCQSCTVDSVQNQSNHYVVKENVPHNVIHTWSNGGSEPGTPSSSGILDDPVTSSNYNEKSSTTNNQSSPDSRPIQGGTVSTSNVSPIDSSHSDPPTPNPQTPTPPQKTNEMYSMYNTQQPMNQSREICSSVGYQNVNSKSEQCCTNARHFTSGYVTTMASGRTVGSNTITSVLAGRANTATVSINSPSNVATSTPSSQSYPVTINVTKSPLEMVQSVVSSIQVPPSIVCPSSTSNTPQNSPNTPPKHSPLPPGHILVSSGGQLIMASTTGGSSQPGVMAPPPPKIITNQGSMPPISVSPMVTNVTAAVTQVIPAVAQQVLGQQTVLVNALPAPFVLQPGVTMTMDGMTVGQNVQIPQLVAGNVIQQQIQIDSGGDSRRAPALLSPETKKKGKKRKMSSQTVAGMLQIAAQQNSGVVQGFPQQIQMAAHSPQGLTAAPVMQALTIVPSKTGGPPQIVMNGQSMANGNHLGAQQLIANSQPAQQINLLQPVNLINGATGVVQNFPTIQQFIVPNLGGMVMNPDGTATILQDTNLGMQLQLQNLNGQNVLTPVQNGNMFNGSQSILAASPAGMVIRTPSTSQGKILQSQQQQHSPGAQFLSPNGGQFVVNGAQFGGQLSPLVASVSPSQPVTFQRPNSTVQQTQQEFIQCGQMGQTLMVPCTPISSSNQPQNTTYVQQNTTIVQQQTTMVSNNHHHHQQQHHTQHHQQQANRPLNIDKNFIISSNENKQQMQTLLLQQRDCTQNAGYRQSVSTQTAVNQNAQSVTTFCQTSTPSAAGSPPDTTTYSPCAPGGQSPLTADTTTHTGSTDDGLSPAPSNCCDPITTGKQQPSSTMAMVHCISSSEPDSADMNLQNSEHDWSRDKRNFIVGDLVWGPVKNSPAWPGKIVEVNGNNVSVRWFGNDNKLITILDTKLLQTLTEGLDAHHQARKKCRTSRKLNSQLEAAIQQAMIELDKDIEKDTHLKPKYTSTTKKSSMRLKKISKSALI